MTRFDGVTCEIELDLAMVDAGVKAMQKAAHDTPERLMVDILVAALTAAGFKPVAVGEIKGLWD